MKEQNQTDYFYINTLQLKTGLQCILQKHCK